MTQESYNSQSQPQSAEERERRLRELDKELNGTVSNDPEDDAYGDLDEPDMDLYGDLNERELIVDIDQTEESFQDQYDDQHSSPQDVESRWRDDVESPLLSDAVDHLPPGERDIVQSEHPGSNRDRYGTKGSQDQYGYQK